MLNGRTVSMDLIIEQLYQDYGFENIDKAEVAEWIWRSMGIIGTLEPYQELPIILNIEDYRCLLPMNLYAIDMVREQTTGVMFREMSDSFNTFGNTAFRGTIKVIGDVDPASETGEYYETIIGPDASSEYYTYKVQGNYMYFGMETGVVEVQYKAIPIDIVNGMPTIPDNAIYIRGVVSFIAERMAFRMMLKDMISERKYDIILRDYLFNVGAARNVCKIPDKNKMESIINRWKSTYLGPEHFDTGLMYLGSRE